MRSVNLSSLGGSLGPVTIHHVCHCSMSFNGSGFNAVPHYQCSSLITVLGSFETPCRHLDGEISLSMRTRYIIIQRQRSELIPQAKWISGGGHRGQPWSLSLSVRISDLVRRLERQYLCQPPSYQAAHETRAPTSHNNFFERQPPVTALTISPSSATLQCPV